MNKHIKRITLSTSIVAVTAIPIVSSVSCSTGADTTQVIKMAVSAASSMNFISYKISAGVMAPTALPLITSMPPDSIKNKYQLLPVKMKDAAGAYAQISTLTHGAMEPSLSGDTFLLDASGRNLTFTIRDYMRWENGDKIVAENWVDTIKAMLDLNNSSEYLYDIERLGITNAAESYQAQIDFFHNNGFTYKDPFNYGDTNIVNGKPTPRQIAPADMPDSVAIEKNLFPYSLKVCTELGVESDGDFKFIIHFNHKETLNFFQNIMTPIFWPINRPWIMSHGGFERFGKDSDHMLASGAYRIDSFDSKYGVEFSKNPNYYNEPRVITPNIDFTFISNPQTLNALYEDGKIISTSVGIDYLPQYLSDPVLRGQTSRTTGVGTLAMFLNRWEGDERYPRPEAKVFNDINFRKALYYGIDRQQILAALHLDFSNPVSVYTAASSTSSDGELYLESLDGMTYDLEAPAGHPFPNGTPTENKPMMNSPIESRGYQYRYDNFQRRDTEYNVDIARTFMAAAKDANPDMFPVTIDYPYNSADPVGKGISVVMEDYLNKSFGGDVRINAIPLPVLVYQSRISEGDWDLQIKQIDPSTRRPWDYMGEFIEADTPDRSIGKTIGYLRNNTGGATYKSYFEEITAQQEQQFLDSFFESSNPVQREFNYRVVKYFVTQEAYTDATDPNVERYTYKNQAGNDVVGKEFDNEVIDGILYDFLFSTDKTKYNQLNAHQRTLLDLVADFRTAQYNMYVTDYNKQEAVLNSTTPGTEQWTIEARKLKEIGSDYQQAKSRFMESSIPYSVSFDTVYPVMDAIIKDMVPVIPLAEADNRWVASRAMGASTTPQGYWANPEYLYDGTNKPSWLDSLGEM